MNQDLQNVLELYSNGKKNYNENSSKALYFFKQSMNEIKNIKKSYENIEDSDMSLLNSTEIECKKYLMKNINLFNIISKNNIELIKKIKKINFTEINKKGNTILHHCIDIGDTMILKELLKKGGCIDQINEDGNTLLEYACLKKDPNIINFLINHGADLKKHLYFRGKDKVLYLNKSDIDSAILLKVGMNLLD